MQAKVKDITRMLEMHYPLKLAEKWDNVGLQIGSYQNQVRKILVTLDLDSEILTQAIDQNIDLIITHHPLFFNPIKSINFESPQGSLIQKIIKNNISVYTAHTNLDSASKGLNQHLAEKLGLQDIKTLDVNFSETLYKLVVYVPAPNEAEVREAIGNADAGHLGNYSHCSFRSQGIGTFMPLQGSNPFLGKQGILEEVEELRLETIVPQNLLAAVISQMKAAHPYEEPAYDVYPLANQGQAYSPGRIGKLATTMSLHDFCMHTKAVLGLDSLRLVGSRKEKISKVAIVSGAGASFIPQALAANCDLLLTGDLKYHEAREAEAHGMAVIDAGHQGTEQLMAGLVTDLLRGSCKHAGFQLEVIPVVIDECIKTI